MDDFEACIAHLRFPVTHRRAIQTTNLLERLFVEERSRLKIIPNAFAAVTAVTNCSLSTPSFFGHGVSEGIFYIPESGHEPTARLRLIGLWQNCIIGPLEGKNEQPRPFWRCGPGPARSGLSAGLCLGIRTL
jgi:hypothetical protein